MKDLSLYFGDLSDNNFNDKIAEFEKLVANDPNAIDGKELPTDHNFTDGLYIRTLHIPAGWVVVGKKHRHEHPSFLEFGKIWVVSESSGLVFICAPKRIIQPAGTKRIGLAVTDCIWTTIHSNPENEKDLEILENKYTYPELLEVKK